VRLSVRAKDDNALFLDGNARCLDDYSFLSAANYTPTYKRQLGNT